MTPLLRVSARHALITITILNPHNLAAPARACPRTAPRPSSPSTGRTSGRRLRVFHLLPRCPSSHKCHPSLSIPCTLVPHPAFLLISRIPDPLRSNGADTVQVTAHTIPRPHTLSSPARSLVEYSRHTNNVLIVSCTVSPALPFTTLLIAFNEHKTDCIVKTTRT